MLLAARFGGGDHQRAESHERGSGDDLRRDFFLEENAREDNSEDQRQAIERRDLRSVARPERRNKTDKRVSLPCRQTRNSQLWSLCSPGRRLCPDADDAPGANQNDNRLHAKAQRRVHFFGNAFDDNCRHARRQRRQQRKNDPHDGWGTTNRKQEANRSRPPFMQERRSAYACCLFPVSVSIFCPFPVSLFCARPALYSSRAWRPSSMT